MSNLVADIKSIQRAVGADPDGRFGPATAARVLAVLNDLNGVAGPPVPRETVIKLDGEILNLDARTVKTIGTLDPKARDRFTRFMLLANATAATFGCQYVLISGHRTWEEQNKLQRQPFDGKDNDGDGRVDESDEKVTNAKGGQSNHNFGIAADGGVFQGKAYLDGGSSAQWALAAKVHKAVSIHAAECGLEWGGTWTGFVDLPHWEVKTGLTLAQKRELYQQKGSVL